ncbi:thiol-disulfide oxidoreductase DCC family protein [Aurantiacibacter gangjinensis]|uniref:Thiol-disulfide oxidoreductase n=1 Tax=Aurantiacibacter gangjinensis TaxID=502682 RepID=A0A0G9MR21_9SPHN|nr:DUF393 domain-containing protein [Aurantiacibacter gangjinensis]APE29087.1 hypothetical protein BMF35_a2258 [Aurantiacibacter gangjinensis]KLE33176.1 thiol-disulfide oxidoreductase [Aurantiacibacter gangjinensis]
MADVTVFYDGACPLCRREIALMQRLDRRGAIRFTDVSEGAPESCPVAAEDLLRRFHVLEDGRMLTGAAGFAAMWRAIPLLKPFGHLARIPLVERVLERLYVAFLRVRPRLQRWAGG